MTLRSPKPHTLSEAQARLLCWLIGSWVQELQVHDQMPKSSPAAALVRHGLVVANGRSGNFPNGWKYEEYVVGPAAYPALAAYFAGLSK